MLSFNLKATLMWLLMLATLAHAQEPMPGKNHFELRGQRQDIYYYKSAIPGDQPVQRILFLPGDGGWRGFAVTMAKQLAGFGCDVYGLDTKRYLSGFTTSHSTLSEGQVMSDLALITQWLQRGNTDPIVLMGWSEGAGLTLLAAADSLHKNLYSGLLTVGLPMEAFLGWRTVDELTYITKKDPNEPMFNCKDYVARVSPIPFAMIQSSQDEYVSPSEVQELFHAAREPKMLYNVRASDHKFKGNTKDFFDSLHRALLWLKTSSQKTSG